MTPFSLLLGKHRRQQSHEDIDLGKRVHNKHKQDSPAVKEVGLTTVKCTNKAMTNKSFRKASVLSFQLLHTPAHVLPSASFLCPIFINSLLISKENKR